MNGPSKGYVRVAVETRIPWPNDETVRKFGGRQITLSPETDQLMPSVMVPFGDGFTSDDALRLLSEFATALAWNERQAVNLSFGTAGTSASLMLGKPPARGPAGAGRFDYLARPTHPTAKLALALYREGLTVNLVPYQFLAFYRIIDLHVGPNKRQQQVKWINDELPNLNEPDVTERIAELKKAQSNVGRYLFRQDRCAAAHASLEQPTINPDEPADSMRLYADLPIVRALATRIIEHHLSVKSGGWHS